MGLQYSFYQLKGKIRSLINKHFGKKIGKIKRYAGKRMLDSNDTQSTIREWIMTGKPFMVARFGSVELRCVAEGERYEKKGRKVFSKKTWKSMGNNAGLFPVSEKNLVNFSMLMKSCCKEVDLLGIWFVPMEDYMLQKYMKNTQITRLRYLEAFRFSKPWTEALEGKKVLVIHPFVETICKQYEKRTEIWPERKVLPKFELFTIKAVQSASGECDTRFKDWFEALNYMKSEIQKIDFDIAIIGCGAYGFPLASYVKKMGKQAIHLGGGTQLLFGIMGKRWETDEEVVKCVNQAWTRPSNEETPDNKECVEGGCYW